ncbi:MAG: radical SAM peptide maturase [Bacteroidales bacterium]|jgi:uncharacterized protein|nr:radical SAM peptide maturase [Bacteroidales bacterium]
MKSDIIFKTKGGNHYLLDKNREMAIYLSPDLKKAIQEPDNATNEYYNAKSKWLINNGFFNPMVTNFTTITKESIDNQIENLEQIVFEVTDNCNLDCKYCGYGTLYENYDVRKKNKMSTMMGKTLLDYFFELWNNSKYKPNPPRRIYLSFYGGEPLLNMPFIKEMVQYTLQHPSKFYYFENTMTTNAILLDKHMNYLVENNFSLLISLDGSVANNAYRVYPSGKPSFDKVYNNIKLLQNTYPEFFKKRVSINSVLHNKNSVSDIHKFIKEAFNKVPSTGSLNSSGIKEDKRDEFHEMFKNLQQSFNESDNYTELSKEMYFSIPNKRTLVEFIFAYSGNVFRHYHDLFLEKAIKERRQTGTCVPFEKKLFVTVNGKILPCTTVGQNYPLGFITNDKVELNSQYLADKYQHYYDKLNEQCKECFKLDSCKECIYFMVSKNKHFVCNKYLNESDFRNQLSFVYTEMENTPAEYKNILENINIE